MNHCIISDCLNITFRHSSLFVSLNKVKTVKNNLWKSCTITRTQFSLQTLVLLALRTSFTLYKSPFSIVWMQSRKKCKFLRKSYSSTMLHENIIFWFYHNQIFSWHIKNIFVVKCGKKPTMTHPLISSEHSWEIGSDLHTHELINKLLLS